MELHAGTRVQVAPDDWLVWLLLTNGSCDCSWQMVHLTVGAFIFPTATRKTEIFECLRVPIWQEKKHLATRHWAVACNLLYVCLKGKLTFCVCCCGFRASNHTGWRGLMAHQFLTCPCAAEVLKLVTPPMAESPLPCRCSAFVLLENNWLQIT